jgi:ketose-bisphosphate aldolase
MDAKDIMLRAQKAKTIIPAFNIPYLPMMKPVIDAIVDENAIAMVQVARLEWEKFESKSLEAVAEEYFKHYNEKHTMLHLDHVPVIDEDNLQVEYMPILKRAVQAGYQSVMIDASRLDLQGNIAATKQAADFAHENGIPCEAELGAVAGHATGDSDIPYEELYRTKKGFTNLEEAKRFVEESGCDWLSVAAGSVHGAIAENVRRQKKPEAKLDIAHIRALRDITGNVPLVLHGGSGIKQDYILQAIQNGITKINVGTEIRQAYENTIEESGLEEKARESVYVRVREVISGFLRISGSRSLILG